MFSFWIFSIIISCSDSGVCPESNPRPNLCLIKICMFSIGLFSCFSSISVLLLCSESSWILLLPIPSLRQWCMPRIKPSAKLIYRFHRTEVVPILGKGPTTESPFALTFGAGHTFLRVKYSILLLHFGRNRQSGNTFVPIYWKLFCTIIVMKLYVRQLKKKKNYVKF